MQFGEKRTHKHFEKQQNGVWRKNERTNISKNRQMKYYEKTNGQTFRKKQNAVDMHTQSRDGAKRRGAANLKQNLSYPQISKFMKLIYGTTIFPRGKHSFERRTGRGRNSISFMVICLAVLLRVHAMTSYFCCLGT